MAKVDFVFHQLVSQHSFCSSLLHTAIDSKGEGEGPVYNYRPFVAPFFIAFIIVRLLRLSTSK